MTETLSEQQLLDLRQAFSSVDYDNDGLVYTKDIRKIFTYFDESLKTFIIEEDELKNLIDGIVLDNHDQITFTQFLTLLSYKFNVNDTIEELQEAFRMFDRTDSGFITIDDLWHGMQNLGENLTKHEIEEMMQEADRDQDGKINFAEFTEIIRYK
ncbi:unnamed protein product [Adineta steineri]|uniref:EF-hand domain-containing protein n=1 Tax=Adineta steineri TaxID=433720 RepID=A0A814K6Q8_9BILA|nr:unnamed protein product [Adineta steineri]CAF1255566.1 unnamed protein product [Adineta steineri]CAF1260635.1 unnamed protein product [Adineta steineri]CAF1316556.1 unnamed protein product [Adineta steineri]CAF3625684.1 unnamed protein product [Adineta steineri]